MMKKVLITGAAGTLGLVTLKYLLSEGKYDITVLDLKNKGVYHKLKKYYKRVEVVYGDILNRNLIEKLVKDKDVVIHLASCLPPMGLYNKEIPGKIETEGTENIVRAINYYNPSCHLIYGSTTSVYGNVKEATVRTKINKNDLDEYSKAKLDAENVIIKGLKNYSILRFSLVLSNLVEDNFIYNIDKSKDVEVISKEDAALAIIGAIDNPKANKKIFNVSGGENSRTPYKLLVKQLLNIHGLSNKYLSGKLIEKNYNSPFINDSDNSNSVLDYQNDSIQTYLQRQRRRSSKRKISILVGKLFK